MSRYQTLDGLRGVAALIVVVFHLTEMKLEPPLAVHGYLAVDFFFVLSGFVISHAYERRLLTSLTLGAFFAKRIVRLYPLALLGAGIGLAVLLMKWRAFPDKVDPLPSILISGVLNMLMLPTFFGTAHSRFELYPGNGPLWSLFFELGVNLVWAWIGVRMRTKALIVTASAAGAAVVLMTLVNHGANIGFDVATFPGGVARVGFGFTTGVLIHRLRDRLAVPARPWGPLAIAALLALALMIPASLVHGAMANAWWDTGCILILLPALVMAGAGQGGGGSLSRFLGDLSYPIYVLHFPVLEIVSGLHQTALRRVNVHLLSGASIAGIVLFSWAALKFYDEPLREYFGRRQRHPGPIPRGAESPPRITTPF